MGRRDALAKRQPQPAAALTARAGFIHHIKRLGDAGQFLRGDAAAGIGHRQGDGIPALAAVQRNGAAGRGGPHGVLHQIAEQIQQQVGVPGHDGRGGRRGLQHRGRAGRPQPWPQAVQRDRRQGQRLLAQAKQRQQLMAQRLKPPPLMGDGCRGLALLCRVGLHCGQNIRIADDARHRGFQLMGERPDKILPPLDIGLQVGDLLLHSVRHCVKAAAQRLDFVPGVQRGAAGIVTGGDLRPGLGQHSQRAGQPRGQQRRDERCRPQHHDLKRKEPGQRGAAAAVQLGAVVGSDKPQPALQVAGVDGVDCALGADGDGGGILQREVCQPRQGGADKGIPPPECGRALLRLDPGSEGGVPDGDTAALQVDDLGLQQGAGLANIGAAVNSGSYLMMDQDATDSYADGKIKAELGDDPQRTGEYSFGFTLYNLENTDSTFTLSADFFTQAALQGELNNGNGQVMNFSDKKTAALAADVVWDVDGKTLKPEMPAELDGCDFDGSGKVTADDGQALLDYVTGVRTEISGKSCADLDKDGDIDTYDAYLFFSRLSSAAVTVPANGKIHVTIRAKVLGLDSYDEKNGGAGAYVEGYVFANEVSSKEGVEGTSHSIPVLGYYGNWTDASMFDVGSFIQYHYGMETRPPYMLAAIQQAAQLQSLTIKYKGVDDSYSLGGNLYVDDGFYDADRYSINPDTAKISDIYFSLIRNAANGRITVTGEDGTVYLNKETQAPIIGAYYFSNQKTWMQVQSGLSVDCAPDAAEGEKLTVKLTMAPEYYVDYSGSTLSTDWDALGEGASQTYTMFVDKTAPTLTDITLSEDLINDGRVMTVTASDNRYVAAAVLYDYSTGKILARTGGSPKGASRGEAVTMSLDANGTANAAHLLLQVYDYANNCSTYKINLNKSELNDPVAVSLNRSTLKLFKGGTATLEAEVTPFGIHPDTVTWTSDNTNVATVDEDGTVTGIGDGTATITATSVKDPTKSAACTVTVEVLKVTLTGALMDGSSTSQFYTWDMENDTTWTPGAVMEVDGITSTAYDTDRNNVIVVDGNERKLHQVDMESGKVLADYDAVAGGNFNVPLFDLEYSELFTKGDVPACYSIYNFMLNKPAELGSIRTDGFMLFMDFLLYGNGADKFTAMTSLGKTKLDLDQDGTAETDAEVLLLLDNRGNVWTFQIYDGIDYSSTTGKYEIAKSNLTSAFKMYFMGDDNGTPLCSMVPTTVNGQLALYLSYFTGKANELYRLTYDSAKNFWTGEKLASFGENVYPATILKIDNHEASQTELEQIVSNLPLGSHTVQSQDLTDMLNSAAVEEAAASYGALNTATERKASAKPAADIASEQPASSEIITSEDQNTVTLKLVPGGMAPTTNGLMSVSYDAAGWELKNVIGNAQYFSYKAEAGKVTLGYVSVDSMPAGEQVAELTFTKTNAGKDADPRFTVQKTERNEQRIDEVEHLTASSNRDDPCPSKEFRDLSTTAWYHESVDYVLSKGIMQGYGDGTFRPDETATRAQVVTLLYRIAGEPAVDDSKALPFTDVNLESWYGSALRWAYQNGITTGVSADSFAPDDCVTREQMVSFLARYAKVTGAYEKVSEDLSSFSDRDRVSSYAVESMQWAVANGFILGISSFLVIGGYLVLKGNGLSFAFAVSGCLGAAMILAMLISSLSGTVIPIFFQKIGVDPAVASGPLITTVNDLVAVITYYGLAWVILINLLHLA